MSDPSQLVPQLQREIEALRLQLADSRQGLAASHELARVLALLGHALRDPLAPMRNAAALLRLAGSNDPVILGARKVIDRQVTLLMELADALLAKDMPPRRSGPADPVAPPSARPRRILIVEDLLDAAITMEILLEMLGHTVEIAADGESGLFQADRFAPEIIFCDIDLPGLLDGYQLARTIRATPRLKNSYLIALTGLATPEEQVLTDQAGFNLHLIKPIDPATLEPLILGIPA